jgi:hypothetical protein
MTTNIKLTESDAHATVEALTFTMEALRDLPFASDRIAGFDKCTVFIELLVADDASRVQAQ